MLFDLINKTLNELKIFDIFFRSSDFKNGLGIGLYIVKEALNRLKGKIEVQSTFGKGSHFTLTIPNQPIPVTQVIAKS